MYDGAMNRECVELRIKAVPGASRTEVGEWLGDRLKVRVAAPPEDGKANRAICELVARHLGVSTAGVEIVSGASRAQKTLRIAGASATEVARVFGMP